MYRLMDIFNRAFEEIGITGRKKMSLGSSADQNRLWRARRGLQGERDHRFDDILDIIPGIEGLGARDQRWDKYRVPGKGIVYGKRKRTHLSGARVFTHDPIKKAGLAHTRCKNGISCLLKEIGF